jgi:hypothetical protein
MGSERIFVLLTNEVKMIKFSVFAYPNISLAWSRQVMADVG